MHLNQLEYIVTFCSKSYRMKWPEMTLKLEETREKSTFSIDQSVGRRKKNKETRKNGNKTKMQRRDCHPDIFHNNRHSAKVRLIERLLHTKSNWLQFTVYSSILDYSSTFRLLFVFHSLFAFRPWQNTYVSVLYLFF